jgi:hypothetical protein
MSSQNPDQPTFQEFFRDMREALMNLPYWKGCITTGREQEVIPIGTKLVLMKATIKCKEGTVVLTVSARPSNVARPITRRKAIR